MLEVKDKWAYLITAWLAFVPVAVIASTPSADFLELLGQFSALEEMGVDVDQQIEARQVPKSDEISAPAVDPETHPLEPQS